MINPNISDVLAAVNEIRAEHNIGDPLDSLPCGRPASCWDCPIAGALSSRKRAAQVGRTDAILGIKEGVITLPQVVQDFIFAFDAGQYPDLLSDG